MPQVQNICGLLIGEGVTGKANIQSGIMNIKEYSLDLFKKIAYNRNEMNESHQKMQKRTTNGKFISYIRDLFQ